ncbi:MAG: hypothetical protein JXR65_03755 [Bacteroidales bacterium]|nr:hypothetical protein [Bacteroidales bacterium]
MKSKSSIILGLVLAGLISLLAWQCNTTPINPAVKQYSYLDPVVNPPDTFQLIYNLSTYGDKMAYVTFQDSAVWQIKVLSDGRALFGIIDPKDSTWKAISAVDTLGFQGSTQYTFVANNNNIDNLGSYFVEFTKLPITYNDYSKKY